MCECAGKCVSVRASVCISQGSDRDPLRAGRTCWHLKHNTIFSLCLEAESAWRPGVQRGRRTSQRGHGNERDTGGHDRGEREDERERSREER